MANRRKSTEARARELEDLRRDPRYYAGLLIDKAAEAAMDVGRPAYRVPTGRIGQRVVRGNAGLDYDSIDKAFEADFVEKGDPGWVVDESDQKQPAEQMPETLRESET